MPWADTLAAPRKAGASSSLARTTACRPFRASREAEPVRLLYGESDTLRQPRAVPNAASGCPEAR
jgi:hypothetical protein